MIDCYEWYAYSACASLLWCHVNTVQCFKNGGDLAVQKTKM